MRSYSLYQIRLKNFLHLKHINYSSNYHNEKDLYYLFCCIEVGTFIVWSRFVVFKPPLEKTLRKYIYIHSAHTVTGLFSQSYVFAFSGINYGPYSFSKEAVVTGYWHMARNLIFYSIWKSLLFTLRTNTKQILKSENPQQLIVL